MHTIYFQIFHLLQDTNTNNSSYLSVLYMSEICSPIPPTEIVLPPTAQWSMGLAVVLAAAACTEGKRPFSLLSAWLTKTAQMANKNTAQGTKMATRMAAAIVVWNVSHDGV